MRTIPMFVEETNLSVAWARAFLRVMERGVKAIAPLTIHLTGFQDNRPEESEPIRACLDGTLKSLGMYTCQSNANLICPIAWYERAADRHAFFKRFLEFYPGLRRWNRLNRNGTYFGRMVAFGRGPEDGNQLEHLIKNYTERDVSRPTAMVVSVFDAGKDHTAQRRRGFPCLNMVQFADLGRGKLSVNAHYPCQFLFDRAYGNYLGLCQLGRFMAQELDLKLTQMTCTIGIAQRGGAAKRDLRDLEATLRTMPEVRSAITAQEAAHAHAG
jgi:hypothetical protein